jgi:hypothetical protein
MSLVLMPSSIVTWSSTYRKRLSAGHSFNHIVNHSSDMGGRNRVSRTHLING